MSGIGSPWDTPMTFDLPPSYDFSFTLNGFSATLFYLHIIK